MALSWNCSVAWNKHTEAETHTDWQTDVLKYFFLEVKLFIYNRRHLNLTALEPYFHPSVIASLHIPHPTSCDLPVVSESSAQRDGHMMQVSYLFAQTVYAAVHPAAGHWLWGLVSAPHSHHHHLWVSPRGATASITEEREKHIHSQRHTYMLLWWCG